MSDKTPILEVRNKFGELYVARDGITVLTEGDPCDAGLIHGIVRAWNALALAGLTPEALAADPLCVKKLVDHTSWIASQITDCERKMVSSDRDLGVPLMMRLGIDHGCSKCLPDGPMVDGKFVCFRHGIGAALRACGIET